MALTRIRDLEPDDRGKQLGDMLQLLIAAGDEVFVNEILASLRYRVDWVIHRDGLDLPKKAK